MNKKRRSQESGIATLIVLILLAVLSGYGAESYFKANAENRIARREVQGRQAVYAAEAGLELAKAALRENMGWRKETRNMNGGNVVVEAVPQNEGYWVTSAARIGLAQKKIKVFLLLVEGRWQESIYQDVYS